MSASGNERRADGHSREARWSCSGVAGPRAASSACQHGRAPRRGEDRHPGGRVRAPPRAASRWPPTVRSASHGARRAAAVAAFVRPRSTPQSRRQSRCMARSAGGCRAAGPYEPGFRPFLSVRPERVFAHTSFAHHPRSSHTTLMRPFRSTVSAVKIVSVCWNTGVTKAPGCR